MGSEEYYQDEHLRTRNVIEVVRWVVNAHKQYGFHQKKNKKSTNMKLDIYLMVDRCQLMKLPFHETMMWLVSSGQAGCGGLVEKHIGLLCRASTCTVDLRDVPLTSCPGNVALHWLILQR